MLVFEGRRDSRPGIPMGDRDTAWQQAALKALIEEPAEGQMF